MSVAPEMWTAAGAAYNSTSKGYEVEGIGTYYKSTSGGTVTSSTDNDANWDAGKNYFGTGSSLFIFAPANSVSGLRVYMKGTGYRTLSSVKTASSLNGTYTTLTDNTDYTYSSTCSNTSYITTSSTRDIVTFDFTSALAAGTFVQITLSGGNAYIYGIEPVTASPTTTYTVKFYDGDTQYGETQTIAEGAKVEAPATSPTKENYTFKGWALSEGSTSRVLFPYPVYSDVNFYAVYSENTSGGSGEEETIFSAVATAALSVSAGASNQEITSANATITGGNMYVYNGQSDAINLIRSQGGNVCFTETNDNTFFKVTLNKALAAGDKISSDIYVPRNSATRGLWLTTATSRPKNSVPTATLSVTNPSTSSDAWMTSSDYVVREGDGICGQTTFYIYRATTNSTYFTNFTITREGQAIGDEFTLDAATDYENFDGYTGEGKMVTLRRNFTEGKWATLVLPFDVNATQLEEAFEYADECELANISSMNVDAKGKGRIRYITVNSIEANKPVLARIKPNESGKYEFSGVTVVAVDPASVVSTSSDGNLEMHGVYKQTGYGDISRNAYFLSGGKFYDWSYLNAIPSFSAYILPVGESLPSSLSFDIEETGINSLRSYENEDETLRYENENVNEYYNVAGQRVGNGYRGMIIIKGNKVLKR